MVVAAAGRLARSTASRGAGLGLVALLALGSCRGLEHKLGHSPRSVAAKPHFAAGAADLAAFIQRELADKGVPGIAIAVVDRGEVVWAAGFGHADLDGKEPMRAGAVQRVGSISKLCVDLALLAQVEAGRLDLDAPVTQYLPEFKPSNPFGEPITVRHLITHHAGLVREPPRGHYFDAAPPDLAETVRSMNETTLVYAPGTRFKYSNAGLAVAGRVLETLTGEPFEQHVARVVFAPLAMTETSFAPSAALRQRVPQGAMWTLDGRVFAAPRFDLGMGPAANLYATVTDLARFTASWSRGVERRCPVGEALLEQAFTPQFTGAGRDSGIGLGFFVDRFDGRRRVGHGGAMYGFATELAALPDEDCGVAVVASMDFASGVAGPIADRALRWVLASRDARALDPLAAPRPVGTVVAREVAGSYRGPGGVLQLYARGEDLWVEPPQGLRARVRRAGADPTQLVVDDRLYAGAPLRLESGAVQWGRARWERDAARANAAPPPPIAQWRDLIGEYGWDHNVLYVLERAERLCILIEWFELNPLLAGEPDRFRLADRGLYKGEEVRFHRDERGRVVAVSVGAVRFPRRPQLDAGVSFRVEKQRDEHDLRRRAQAARPPANPPDALASDLVDLVSLDPSLRLDLRYATTDNFMGLRFYDVPRAWMQRPAAEALVAAHRELEAMGYGLIVFDAYRPWFVTKMFWDATPPELRTFVADPAHGSRHNRGCAVDLSLFDRRTGQTVDMVSGFDEFTARAYPDYPGGSSRQRWYRELLRRTMEDAGFSVYEAEWWHFDYRAWRRYPIGNRPL